MDRVTEVTRECFNTLFQLRRLEPSGSARPEALHQQMRRAVDRLMDKAADEGFNQTDAKDMAYAVVALIDEVALASSDAVRDFWMQNLLQRQYFNENQAGNGFYSRLDSIRKDPSRDEVVRAYQLCLLFGFQGRYRVRGGETERLELIDDLARQLRPPRGVDFEVLSPRALPPNEGLSGAAANRTLLFGALGAVAFAVLLFIVLKIIGAHGASTLADGIAQASKAVRG